MDKLVFFTIIIFVLIFGGFLIYNGQYAPKSIGNLTPTPETSLTNLSDLSNKTMKDNIKTPPASQQGGQNQPATPPPPTLDPAASHSAVIKTSKGDITIELYAADTPQTVANFVEKSQSGYYNNLKFHRVEDWVIQGGDPLGNGTGGGDMRTELNQKPFVVGSVGVARGQDLRISNDSQFFITKTNASHLDGQYTNFGTVTSGMDVVEKIAIGDKILEITIQ